MVKKRRGRGEGAIYQRKDGLWVAEITYGYDPQGKQLRKTRYAKTKGEAQEKLRDLQNRPIGPVGASMILGAYLDLYQVTLRPQVSHVRWMRVKSCYNLWVKPHLGHIKLDQLTPVHISAWFNRLVADGVSPATIHVAGKALRQALTHAVDLDLLAKNPATRVKIPRYTKSPTVVWSPDQIHQFLEASRGNPAYPIFILALDTGLRLGEILTLEWSDLDLDNGLVRVSKTIKETPEGPKIGPPKTPSSNRIVRMAHTTIEVLRGIQRPQGLVFPGPRGDLQFRTNFNERIWQPAVAAAGVPYCRFHDLRHLSASYLLAAGESIKVIQERMGHSNVGVTLNTYSHIVRGQQQEAATKMDHFLKGVLTSGQPTAPRSPGTTSGPEVQGQ